MQFMDVKTIAERVAKTIARTATGKTVKNQNNWTRPTDVYFCSFVAKEPADMDVTYIEPALHALQQPIKAGRHVCFLEPTPSDAKTDVAIAQSGDCKVRVRRAPADEGLSYSIEYFAAIKE